MAPAHSSARRLLWLGAQTGEYACGASDFAVNDSATVHSGRILLTQEFGKWLFCAVTRVD